MADDKFLNSSIFLQRFLANPDSGSLSREFCDRYHPCILAAIKKQRINGRPIQDADADDISSGLLLKFYDKGYFKNFVFEGKLKFYAWLRQSVRHAFLEFVRQNKRTSGHWNFDDPSIRSQIEPIIDRFGNDVREIYERDLELGSQAYKRVEVRTDERFMRAFRMMKIENRPGNEVAQTLGMSLAAVYKARERVTKDLRNEFMRLRNKDSVA